MLREGVIADVAAKQRANVMRRLPGLSRIGRLKDAPSGFVTIITGVRRCGKSTLMEQRMRTKGDAAFYLNFESSALAGLDLKDAQRLDRIIAAS